jgi:uncharacterized protein (DUF302 family)
MTDKFSYTTKTGKTIDKTIEDITTSLKEIGFGVLGILDFKAILQKKRPRLQGGVQIARSM